MKPSSSITGTRPFGFIARYSGLSLPPNLPPTSTRSYARPSSSAHHTTFWTLIDETRPQIFSIGYLAGALGTGGITTGLLAGAVLRALIHNTTSAVATTAITIATIATRIAP